MTKLPVPAGNSPYLKVEGRGRQHFRSLARRTLALVAAVAVAAGAWLAYSEAALPQLERSRLESALTALLAAQPQETRERIERLAKLQLEERYLHSFAALSRTWSGLQDDVRIAGARAALDLAVRAGSIEAHVVKGKALRDGLFGERDQDAALKEFSTALRLSETGVRVGDPDALYVRALMLWEGLGVDANQNQAASMARRSAASIRSWRLKRVLSDAMLETPPAANFDFESIASLIRRVMDAGDLPAYIYGWSLCSKQARATDAGQTKFDINAANRLQDCRAEWERKAAEAGLVDAMGEYGNYLLLRHGAVEAAINWFERGRAELSFDEAMAYGLLKILRGANIGQRREGIGLAKSAIARARQDAVVQRDYAPPATGSETMYYLWLSNLSEVNLTSLDQFWAAAAVRAFAVHTNTVNIARTVIQNMDPLQPAARAFDSMGVKSAADELLHEAIPASRPDKALGAPKSELPASVQTADHESQQKSGYVLGAPHEATGGLSGFTVDNARGSGDAVARLYLNGRKPAVRSFFIRQGENFTATNLAPGAYVMRYRYMGSDDTYEAARTFDLAQVKNARGTSYSNVTVTLFSVSDGNMQTKRVSNDSF